jgi:hypothetical protein
VAAVGVPSWPHRARNGWRARAGAEVHRGPPLHEALERMAEPGVPDWLDRGIAAVIAGLAFAVPVPLVVLLITRPMRDFGGLLQTGAALWWGLPIWCAITFGVGVVAGAVLGTARLGELLGHFWGTARPSRPRITIGLWLSLGVIVAVSYVAVRHAL